MDPGWEGGSFDDVFASKGKAPTSFARPPSSEAARGAPTPSRSRGAPGGDSQWGGGLGDVLRKPDDERHRYGQPANEGSGAPAPQAVRAVRAAPAAGVGWEPGSLGDVLDAKAPARSNFGQGGSGFGGKGAPHGTGGPASPAAAAAQPSARRRPAAEDPWSGASLGDALAPRRTAAVATGGGAAASRGGGGPPAARVMDDGSKPPGEIVKWLRELPASHVPDKAKEDLAAIVEQGSMNGTVFSEYVLKVPPEICAPQHAMKLKAAWKNVLAEAAARAICRQNLEHATKAPKKGGVKVDC